ncbi:MAG: metallophosphoesterase family protein [Chloroflexota bacterium]
MLIGLLSDTHINSPNETLPPQLKAAFRGVDLILHAGDIWIPSVLDELESIAPVFAAWGDDDMEADLGGDSRMMKGQALHLDDVTIWLAHIKPRSALIKQSPKEEPSPSRPNGRPAEGLPDVVVFGHTHLPTIEDYKGVLLVNPGSATMPNYMPQLGTVAFLKTSPDGMQARIVQLE